MEHCVNSLNEQVPPPKRIPYGESFVFRHVEKSPYQAIVQKLARMVSTLHSAYLLLNYGFVQEQATLERILDEIQEDVCFLSYGIISGDLDESLHKKYLDAFFQEEFDSEDPMKSTQKRPTVSRRKVRAYIAKKDQEMTRLEPTKGVHLSRILSKTYSGYVHAASPHIMSMYGGSPPRFHMTGMVATKVHHMHKEEIWNYFYRGLTTLSFATKVFGNSDLDGEISACIKEFEKTPKIKAG
ncbi:MAG: hypothetical protein OXC97_05450 [Candidatus Dadabacteria bacterium]|nr:hypothetical protein [Candidatus Dadabacteria bacterium]